MLLALYNPLITFTLSRHQHYTGSNANGVDLDLHVKTESTDSDSDTDKQCGFCCSTYCICTVSNNNQDTGTSSSSAGHAQLTVAAQETARANTTAARTTYKQEANFQLQAAQPQRKWQQRSSFISSVCVCVCICCMTSICSINSSHAAHVCSNYCYNTQCLSSQAHT
jgi:hypothetical protein